MLVLTVCVLNSHVLSFTVDFAHRLNFCDITPISAYVYLQQNKHTCINNSTPRRYPHSEFYICTGFCQFACHLVKHETCLLRTQHVLWVCGSVNQCRDDPKTRWWFQPMCLHLHTNSIAGEQMLTYKSTLSTCSSLQ